LIAAALGLATAGSVIAGGDTPTWSDALEASPNRLTPAEEADLAARAASGESALQAPAGVYSPNDAAQAAISERQSPNARTGSDAMAPVRPDDASAHDATASRSPTEPALDGDRAVAPRTENPVR
jgi:hypothetical protein